MPERIFSLKAAMVAFDVATFLDARLSLSDGNVFQPEPMRLKQGALTPK